MKKTKSVRLKRKVYKTGESCMLLVESCGSEEETGGRG